MEEKNKIYGVLHTKEMLDFIFSLVKGIENSLKDGKVTYTDFMYLMPAISKMGSAFKHIGEIPKEWGDLDKEEADDLKKYFAENFDIADDKIEFYIEKAFNIAMSIYFLVKDVVDDNK